MSFAAAFYLYILPLMISAVVLGWMAYDKWKERRNHRPHAGD
jgi:hypothetical protein